jgi:urease accessory protein UreE
MNAEVERRIAALVAEVEKNQKRIRMFSTGEQIAVALVLDRSELFPHGGYTMLEAVERLGPNWTRAALLVQRRRE